MNTMTQPAKDLQDAALGALLGACVGDAAGATLEFLGRKPGEEDVMKAMKMLGGGVWRVAPGQITDDGELTLSLAHALCGSPDFSLDPIARKYADWMQSRPFDCGTTTSQAFGWTGDSDWQSLFGTDSFSRAMQKAASVSMGSKANGSLMRATPLAIHGHAQDVDELAFRARQDSSLSHPNPSCGDAVACYVIAIACLLRVPGDRQQAFATARHWADHHAHDEVKSWLDEAQAGVKVPYQPQDGFVRIAFVHAFRHLLLGTDYVAAIRETLLGGRRYRHQRLYRGGLDWGGLWCRYYS